MFKKLDLSWFTALLLVVLAHPCGARELVAVGTQFSKIFEQTPRGEFVGLGVDVLREFAKQGGDTVRFEMYPWPRAQMLVASGQADILIGPYKTTEREAKLAFSGRPFHQDDLVFYKRKDSSVGWSGDYAQLSGLRIYRINGWAYGEKFDQLNFPYFQTLDQGVMRLAAGGYDLLASNTRNTEPFLEAMQLKDTIVPIEPVIGVKFGYIAFPKDTKFSALRTQYDRFFDALLSSGTLAKLAKKHGVKAP